MTKWTTNNSSQNGSPGTGRIPEAPYYVVSIDTFMSGWGKAKGQRNVCVVPCAKKEIAEAVLEYVKTRPEQKKPRITETYPPAERGVLYSDLRAWIATARREGFMEHIPAYPETLGGFI